VSVITLLTDFGTADGYVGAVKGVLLAAAPRATLVDITHDIPPQDIAAGAFALRTAASFFPEGTVHVAVVDPGVGSARRGIAARAGGHFLVGPDNGIFSYLFEADPGAAVVRLADRTRFRDPVSHTFHGRDVFAPVAAALANGVALEDLGPPIDDPVRLPPLIAEPAPDGTVRSRVVHVDRYGNLVTGIAHADLSTADPAAFVTEVGGRRIRRHLGTYAESGTDEPFTIWGSSGLLEVSVSGGSAARSLAAVRGTAVSLTPVSSSTSGAGPAA
jgi:S-adenosyl-L-methionine hydrolase (adenosine-forming)